MIHRWFSLVLAAAALLLSSCLEHVSTLTLNKDGSGTITEETSVSGEAAAMMEQMAAMGGEGAATLPWADQAEAEKRAKEMGEGVTVQEVTEISKDGRKGGRVIFAFKDINQLQYVPGGGLSEMGQGMAPQAADEAANQPIQMKYADGLLTIVNPEPEAEPEAAEAAPEMDPTQLEMAKGMFRGMRIRTTIELPGGIEKTNASHVNGNTVTLMELEMDKLLDDPKAFNKFVTSQPGSLEEMKTLVEGVDGIKIETVKELTIQLK